MRATVHRSVPEAVRAVAFEWLPDSEWVMSLLERAATSTEVVDDAGPVGVAVLVEGGMSLSGAPIVVACAGRAAVAVADELARSVAARAVVEGQLEVVGPAELARPVAMAVATHTGGQVETVMDERLMVATQVQAPAGVRGSGRAATIADHPLLAAWFDDFAVEALAREPLGEERWLERLADMPWEQWLWEDDGRPVSLVNGRRSTPVSTRLGPVYTPPSLRGRGYAAALTAQVTQVLLDRGDTRVTLFTDEANPTSNALYARVGFADIGGQGSWLVSVPEGEPG